jgi:hypothetical protein
MESNLLEINLILKIVTMNFIPSIISRNQQLPSKWIQPRCLSACQCYVICTQNVKRNPQSHAFSFQVLPGYKMITDSYEP